MDSAFYNIQIWSFNIVNVESFRARKRQLQIDKRPEDQMKKTGYILMSLIHSSFNQITHFKTVATLLFYLDELSCFGVQLVTTSTCPGMAVNIAS